jgi:hypothetical protein
MALSALHDALFIFAIMGHIPVRVYFISIFGIEACAGRYKLFERPVTFQANIFADRRFLRGIR